MTARSTAAGLLFAAVVSAAGIGEAVGQHAPANYSSHDAAFFSDLLSDRVWLYERPALARAGDRGTVWGVHHGADGTARACIHLDGTWQVHTDRWRVVPSARFRALYNYYLAGTEPDPGHVKGHIPVFYEPETGRLHSESLGNSGWFVLSLGWVQESWPQALKQACPDLDLPVGLPVSERQTSVLMEEAIAQDPAAAVRAHRGSELMAPGSTGLALAAGWPTVTADKLARFLAANDGHVLESPAGTRLVLALGPERDELWRLDAGDDVTDTAVLLPAADGAGIAVQWERLPRRQDYRLGDPFPLRPTGERYGAFLLMDRLIGADRSLALPFEERGEMAVRFAPDGTVMAAYQGVPLSEDGDGIGGRWWWSRGDLHVALDGVSETSAYPWRALAAREPWLLGAAPAGLTDGGAAEHQGVPL